MLGKKTRNEQRDSDEGKTMPGRQKAAKKGKANVKKDK